MRRVYIANDGSVHWNREDARLLNRRLSLKMLLAEHAAYGKVDIADEDFVTNLLFWAEATCGDEE
jgi:hypothetical protein